MKAITKSHDVNVRKRAFAIWQHLGYYPWKLPSKSRKKRSGDFYKGAFDSIPFLNDDGKRTFSHLLLRPGYMIRDYIGGMHDKYLAPFASLIIFYAFFALVSAVLQPIQHKDEVSSSSFNLELEDETSGSNIGVNIVDIVKHGYLLLNLDQHPEEVDTRGEAAIAALEGRLRSQGIPLFLGKFLLLWFSMAIALRKYGVSVSAAAAASAYILCQFSFFMLFAVLASFGESTSISGLLMAILLTIDLHQWLGVSWKKGFKLTLKTGLLYLLLLLLVILVLSALVLLIAALKK